MSSETIFGAVNMLALAGWAALVLGWRWPLWSQRIAGLAVPVLLAVAYAGLVLAFWSRAPGGFGSLARGDGALHHAGDRAGGVDPLSRLRPSHRCVGGEDGAAGGDRVPAGAALPGADVPLRTGGVPGFSVLRRRGRRAASAAEADDSARPSPTCRGAGGRRAGACSRSRSSRRRRGLPDDALADAGWRCCLDGRTHLGLDIWLKPMKFQVALAIFAFTMAVYARWLPAGTTGRRWHRIMRRAWSRRWGRRSLWISGARRSAPRRTSTRRRWGGVLRGGGGARVSLTSATLVYGVLIARNRRPGSIRRCRWGWRWG